MKIKDWPNWVKGGIIAVLIYWVLLGLAFLIATMSTTHEIWPVLPMILLLIPSMALLEGLDGVISPGVARNLIIVIQTAIAFLIGAGIVKIVEKVRKK